MANRRRIRRKVQTMRLISLVACLLLLSGCAFQQAEALLASTSTKLDNLSDKIQLLETPDATPAQRQLAAAIRKTAEGTSEALESVREAIEEGKDTPQKLAAAASLIPGPYGQAIAGLIGLFTGGGGIGMAARSMRKGKEASHNHGVNRGIELGTAIANGGARASPPGGAPA